MKTAALDKKRSLDGVRAAHLFRTRKISPRRRNNHNHNDQGGRETITITKGKEGEIMTTIKKKDEKKNEHEEGRRNNRTNSKWQ